MEENRILVVDDEQDLCEIMQFNLENEGYQVAVAYSAEEALARTDLPTFHLFILDIMMGEMSGFKLAQKLKQDPATNQAAIIFVTARDTENDIITGLTLGADDYMAKPFSVRELILRVKAVLRRNTILPTANANFINYKTLSLNLTTKQLNVDGKDINLTKTEFDLLSLLLKYPGRVFSRKELIQIIWHNDVMVVDRVVDVNITRIRKKLGNFAQCLVTRQGFGYCFEK